MQKQRGSGPSDPNKQQWRPYAYQALFWVVHFSVDAELVCTALRELVAGIALTALLAAALRVAAGRASGKERYLLKTFRC
jgi:hypothetical protein